MLCSADIEDEPTYSIQSISYEYDSVGNRIKRMPTSLTEISIDTLSTTIGNIIVYPTITTNNINIIFAEETKINQTKFVLTDIQGGLVNSGNILYATSTLPLNCNRGVYILNIITSTDIHSFKIIKK